MVRDMSHGSPPAEDKAGEKQRKRPELVSQLAFPVIVVVVGAILVTAFTPLGTSIRELLFHTRATVAGSVTVDGKPAVNAHLQLDGADWGNTDVGGRFVLTGVGKGQHRLHLELLGAKPRDEVFSVDSGQTALQVGNLEMEPLVRLGYAASVRLSSAAQFDYDITLWVIGDPDVLSRIKSVSYTLPTPLSPRPVRGASANHAFCYRQVGSLPLLGSLGNSSPALAVVDLGGGQQFQISAPAGTAQPLDCPAQPGTTTQASGQHTPPPQGQSVPPVDGLTLQQAEAQITQAGLTYTTVPQDNATTPKNQVISTNPANGQSAPADSSVTIYYSTGLGPLTLQDYTGQQGNAVQAQLEQDGLKVTIQTDAASTAPSGQVISQSPAAGTRASPGGTVTLTVSGGVKTVPSVIGDPNYLHAEQVLRNAGFQVTAQAQAAPATQPVQPGVVWSQNPAGGSDKPPGTTVTIFYAPQQQ
jgi:hypothetical protein